RHLHCAYGGPAGSADCVPVVLRHLHRHHLGRLHAPRWPSARCRARRRPHSAEERRPARRVISGESIMSHFLDRLTFFNRQQEAFADGHGITTHEDRSWEDGYRKRWQHDKIVRSTHGVNCTGSCSWKIYVKGGIVTWETQQTEYPRTRPDLPNHERRGCSRGASCSW